jgi:hypothetical protein
MESIKDGKDISYIAAMKRVTLLLDGLSRTAILPFGPKLIHRILREQQEAAATISWSTVTYLFALTVAMYSLGRWVGTVTAERLPIDHSKLTHMVARLGGVTFALHLFSFGAGLDAIFWLIIIRFLSGLLAGFLCRVTNARLVSDEDHRAVLQFDEELGAESKHTNPFFEEITSSAAKVYTAGFTLSLLMGGLFYESSSQNTKFQAFTGAEPFTLSPMFFVLMSVVGEACLRLLFWYSKTGASRRRSSMRVGIANSAQQASTRFGAFRRRRRDVMDLLSPGGVAGTTEDNNFMDPQSGQKYGTPSRSPRSRAYSNGSVRSISRSNHGTPGRPRLNSEISVNTTSEFFDCESFGDIEEIMDLSIDEEAPQHDFAMTIVECGEHSETDNAVYRNNKCVYEDGSPAFVPNGECESKIPDNFIRCWGKNRAKKMWLEMQQWRRDSDIWRIHTGPHKLFPRVKDAYYQKFHGFSKKGLPMLYEKPGRMKLKELFQSGITIDQMVNHYFFMMEYIANVVAVKPEVMERRGVDRHRFSNWGFSVVMDVEGISMSMVSKDVVRYMTTSGDVNTRYYPLTTGKVFLVNAPFWLAGVWAGMRNLAPDSLNIEILSKTNALEKMLDYIDEDQIPKQYGGSSPYETDQHPYEIEFRELVKKADANPDFESQPLSTKHTAPEKRPSYSFNYSDQQWAPENGPIQDEFSRTLNTGSWKPELASSLRQRACSADRQRSDGKKSVSIEVQNDFGALAKSSNTMDVLVVVSCMHFLWFTAHGAIECVIPLYILTSPILGGLGYTPARSGFSLFVASILIQWLVRTNVIRAVSQIPNKAPMRALRTSVGTEIVILVILPLLHNSIVSVPRVDSIMNMLSMIVMVAALALSSMLGLTSMSILHRIACENYASYPRRGSCVARMYGEDRLLSHCQTGKLTFLLQSTAAIVGALTVAPVYAWSTLRERPTPFDASFCFFAVALVSCVLYIFSFSLNLNVVGEFVESATNISPRRKQTCSMVGDMVAVPYSDMTTLFEEANMSIVRERLDSRSSLESGRHGTHGAINS